MTTYDWVAATKLAALSTGAAVTDANVGSVSGLGTLKIVTSGGGTAVKDASGALKLNNGTSGVARIELPLVTPTWVNSFLIDMTVPTANPGTDSRLVEIMDSQGTPAFKYRINLLSTTGQARIFDALNASKGTTTPDLSGRIYCAGGAEVATVSPSATNGKLRMQWYDSSFTPIGSTVYSADNVDTIGALAATLKTLRIGRINTITDTGDLLIHSIRFSDSMVSGLTPISAPPTLVIDASTGKVYHRVKANTSSTPGSGGALSFSVSWVSGPNNLADINEPVDGWWYVPMANTTAVYRFTVSEGGNDAFQDVTIPALPQSLPAGSIRRRIKIGGVYQ